MLLCTDPGIPLWGPSGASEHVRAIARGLGRAGHQVRVATPRAIDHRGRVEASLGPATTVHATPRSWPRGLRTVGASWDATALARAALRDGWRPDLIWERHSAHGTPGVRLSRQLGIPRLVELNAPLALERAWVAQQTPRRRALRHEMWSLRRATRVMTVSRWLHRWAVQEARCGPERVAYVPNGTESVDLADREGARRTHRLTGRVVGFVGHRRPWHDVALIPAILERLGEPWCGLVVGSGAFPLHPRLHSIGPVTPAEVPRLIAAMDVALAPTPPSAPPWFCPLKILEYRAQGVPVVASHYGDNAELVGAGGLTVPTPTPEAWAHAIRHAFTMPRIRYIRSWDQVIGEALSNGRLLSNRT